MIELPSLKNRPFPDQQYIVFVKINRGKGRKYLSFPPHLPYRESNNCKQKIESSGRVRRNGFPLFLSFPNNINNNTTMNYCITIVTCTVDALSVFFGFFSLLSTVQKMKIKTTSKQQQATVPFLVK